MRQIMPLVWEHEPACPACWPAAICRAAWTAAIRAYAGSATCRPCNPCSSGCGCPSPSFGADIRGKALESLAAGVPCACSPIAAEGLCLPPALEAMVAEDTHGIACLILALHRDPTLNAQAAWAGLDRATTHPSETALDAALLQAIRTRRPDAAGHAG